VDEVDGCILTGAAHFDIAAQEHPLAACIALRHLQIDHGVADQETDTAIEASV
jgi:hypothetical protein